MSPPTPIGTTAEELRAQGLDEKFIELYLQSVHPPEEAYAAENFPPPPYATLHITFRDYGRRRTPAAAHRTIARRRESRPAPRRRSGRPLAASGSSPGRGSSGDDSDEPAPPEGRLTGLQLALALFQGALDAGRADERTWSTFVEIAIIRLAHEAAEGWSA